jgi:hypothetical protein
MSSISAGSSGAHVQGCQCDSCLYGIVSNLSTPATVVSGKVADFSPQMLKAASALSVMFPRKGRGRKTGKGEVNMIVAPGSKIPFLKQPNLTQITLLQSLAPVNLFTTSTSIPTFFGLSFTVNSLDNFSSLSAVFDQYRIDEISVLVDSQINLASNGAELGQLYTVVDVDDASAPTTLAQLGGYSSCTMSDGVLNHFHRWKPQFAIAAYSGVFTSFAATTGWIDCASPSVQHYGLKGGSGATNSANVYVGMVQMQVSFRSEH